MKPYAERIRGWREDRGILRFVDEQFGVRLDAWQEDALLAFASPADDMARISLQACAGPGKTAVEAWCGLWFLGCQGEAGEHPKGLATSVTKDNLEDNLWPEFSKWMQRSPYLSTAFAWTGSSIFAKDHPDTWFLSARTWPKTANADDQGKTFSGLHARYVLCLIDESGAIPPTVLRAAEQALSVCRFGKILQAGNPISREGMLFEASHRLRAQWHVIVITGDPENPRAWVHSPRVGPGPVAWARQQIETYGRENPWVKSYILGEFPASSINSLLSDEEVEAAMQRSPTPDAYGWAQKRIGIDVARYGDDRTVLYPRQGVASFKPVIMRHEKGAILTMPDGSKVSGDTVSTNIATAVLKAKVAWKSELELMDATGGWGAGARDVLVTGGCPVIDVQFGSTKCDPKYKNVRSYIWFQMAEWVRKGGALAFNPDLSAELTTPTYVFDGGKFTVEPKALVKARIGRSPDIADALAVTFAIPDVPAMLHQMGMDARGHRTRGTGGTALHDFDPYGSRE